MLTLTQLMGPLFWVGGCMRPKVKVKVASHCQPGQPDATCCETGNDLQKNEQLQLPKLLIKQ